MSADRWVLVPEGMSRIDAEFWLRHRADVIEACAQAGYTIVTTAGRVHLMRLGKIEAQAVPAAPAAEPVAPKSTVADFPSVIAAKKAADRELAYYRSMTGATPAPAQSREPLTLTDEQFERVLERHAGASEWSDEEHDSARNLARAAIAEFCRINGIGSREPLTAEQKLILWHKESAVHKRNSAFEWYAAGVEAIERAHGIGSQP